MVEMISLSSTRDGISADFHFLAISNRAACSTLQTAVLEPTGMDSIPSSSRKNSGPLGLGACAITSIRPLILSQKGFKYGQDQNMWIRVPTEPQDLQQWGDEEAYALAIYRGIKYHLVWHRKRTYGPSEWLIATVLASIASPVPSPISRYQSFCEKYNWL